MMNGDKNVFMFLISHVGTGSSWQVLHGDEPISFSISSVVTGVQDSNVGIDLDGTSYSGIDVVDTRTVSILSLKNAAKSSAVWTQESSYADSPSALWSVRHSRCVFPWDVAISLRQNVEFFFSYNSFILLNSIDHAWWSVPDDMRLNRLSAALVRRRAARQSTSNHGVVFLLALRRTVTVGQCWSSRAIITRLYSWTRSSTVRSSMAVRSPQSSEAARSDAKASVDSRLI